MSTTRINSLNLCSKAISYFRESSNNKVDLPDQDKIFLEWVCKTLESSQKFLLPDNGRLMEGIDVVKNADLMRMPYSVTALEYRINENAKKAQITEITSPTRIALCFSATSHALDHFREFLKLPELEDEDGFYVISIFSILNGGWFIVPSLQFIETNPKVIDAKDENLKQNKGVINPTYILPFDTGLAGYVKVLELEGSEAMARNLMIDALDEVNAARAFAVTMNCSKIKEELIVAPKGINKKRSQKGKVLLQDFHILTIDIFKSAKLSSNKKDESERNSPRQHLRRGHVRRLVDKAIWVNASVVGSGDIVEKMYRVKPED